MCREPVFHGFFAEHMMFSQICVWLCVCERNQCSSGWWNCPASWRNGGHDDNIFLEVSYMTLGLQRFLIWWHMHLVTRYIMQIYRSLWSLGSGRVQLEAGVPGRNSHGCLRGEGDCQVAVRERQGGMGKGVFLLGVDSQDMPRCLRLWQWETWEFLRLSRVFCPWSLWVSPDNLWVYDQLRCCILFGLVFGTDFLYILPSEGEPYEQVIAKERHYTKPRHPASHRNPGIHIFEPLTFHDHS